MQYSRTCFERPPHWPQKCGLSRQVVSCERFSYIEILFSDAKNVWSIKTGGLSWQWSLKTGFTVEPVMKDNPVAMKMWYLKTGGL